MKDAKNMKINIIYSLYTDGDYSLKNPESFGCTGKDVKIDDDEYYDYIGSAEFASKDESCKSDAISFLWRFLCDGIHVSYMHPWLLKNFYELIESLEDVINKFENGMSVTRKHIYGNYDGTEIEVVITDFN